jgi:hypothetical protein
MGKICSNCNVEKELIEFHKTKLAKDGYKHTCKVCRKTETKKYYEKNVELLKKRSQKYRFENPEKVKEGIKKYRINSIEKVKKIKSDWEKSENGRKSKKKYYEKNKSFLILKTKKYRKNHPEKEINRRKSEKWKNYMINYKKRYRNEKSYFYVWRSVLYNTLKRIGTKKEFKTNELLGYSAIELKENIEKKFLDDMSWDNWGDWHIDHIKPISSFDQSEKISVINSLDNLQPLWAKDNLKKSNKII